MTKKPIPETSPTVEALTRTRDEAAATLARLRSIDNPLRFGEGAAGAAVNRLELLEARRALPAAETRLLEIEVALEKAQTAQESAERDRLAQVLAQGEALLRREWPPLVGELRAVQGKIQALAVQLAVLDGQLGRQHFQWVAWGAMLPDGLLDYWLRATAAAYGLPLEE